MDATHAWETYRKRLPHRRLQPAGAYGLLVSLAVLALTLNRGSRSLDMAILILVGGIGAGCAFGSTLTAVADRLIAHQRSTSLRRGARRLHVRWPREAGAVGIVAVNLMQIAAASPDFDLSEPEPGWAPLTSRTPLGEPAQGSAKPPEAAAAPPTLASRLLLAQTRGGARRRRLAPPSGFPTRLVVVATVSGLALLLAQRGLRA